MLTSIMDACNRNATSRYASDSSEASGTATEATWETKATDYFCENSGTSLKMANMSQKDKEPRKTVHFFSNLAFGFCEISCSLPTDIHIIPIFLFLSPTLSEFRNYQQCPSASTMPNNYYYGCGKPNKYMWEKTTYPYFCSPNWKQTPPPPQLPPARPGAAP